MNCQSRLCNNPATWTRANAIAGFANALCDGCMFRIYTGFSHHTSNWQKITEPAPEPAPQEQPATIASTTQTELF
jgi:hypothetical protein